MDKGLLHIRCEISLGKYQDQLLRLEDKLESGLSFVPSISKNADLADLGTVMDNVYHTKEDMIECVNAFYEGMVQRSEEMKRHILVKDKEAGR